MLKPKLNRSRRQKIEIQSGAFMARIELKGPFLHSISSDSFGIYAVDCWLWAAATLLATTEQSKASKTPLDARKWPRFTHCHLLGWRLVQVVRYCITCSASDMRCLSPRELFIQWTRSLTAWPLANDYTSFSVPFKANQADTDLKYRVVTLRNTQSSKF